MAKYYERGLLFQAKALGVHDGQLQPLHEESLGLVAGQQERVEAGVASRQLLAVRPILLHAHGPTSAQAEKFMILTRSILEPVFDIFSIGKQYSAPTHNSLSLCRQ